MVRAESVTATLVYTYTADGLRVAQAIDGDVTTFAWDWASGVPEMLRDGTSLYLIGHDTLGRFADGEWAYHLPDALGSVRQVVDGAGSVASSREWTPFGLALSRVEGLEVDGAQPGLGYTGEWHDPNVGLTYLRARWLAPDVGRFTQRDPWQGNIWRPGTLLRGYVYVRNNPVTFRDPSGFTDCSGWPSPIRWMCEQADAGDLDTVDLLYHLIALYAHWKGDDYHMAGFMLYYALEGNGNDLDLSWNWGRRFGEDPNMADAANLLLDAFILNDVKPASQSVPASVVGHYDGLDFYTWDNRPRPQSDGLYGATGHVAVDGDFRADVWLSGSCKYLVKFTADYSVKDYYEWFPGTVTNFGNLFGMGDVIVPHKWAIALRDATPPRAHQYHFTITWRDRGRLLAESDWSDWRRLKWWEIAH